MNKDHRDSHLIFFGKKDEAILLSDIKESRFSLVLQNIVQDFGLQKFVVLDQVHGTDGVIVDTKTFLRSGSRIPTSPKRFDGHSKSGMTDGEVSWFEHQADFLITNQKDIALIVLTADCIPLTLYDPILQTIGLVHAGWKGSYAGVLQETLQAMQKNYGVDFKNLICTFGPSARACCYEVSESFVHDFKKKYPDLVIPGFERESKSLKVFEQRDLKYYFDTSLFLQQILKKFGIPSENIYTDNALCTICNHQFCSFRKEKEMAGRQITMVALL